MNSFLLNLKRQLHDLSDQEKILFSVMTCEKLLPNYFKFQERNDWGDYRTLEESINTVYIYLIAPDSFNEEDFFALLEGVDSITPHTEDFPGILTSFALDCCTAIEDMLNFILDRNSDRILNVASYAYDTVDMYVQEKNDIDPEGKHLEDKIANDQFMKREKLRQAELVSRLSANRHKNITTEFINSLRTDDAIIDLNLIGD